MMGALGAFTITAWRCEATTGAGIAKLGWIDVANRAMNTVEILVRFTLSAISKSV
jgi:hypothetical protein